MPTAIVRPLAVGGTHTWTLGAGADKVAAVDPGDPVSHDNDSSYINGDINTIAQYTHTPLPGDAVGIRGVRAYFRWRTPSDNSMTLRFFLEMNGLFTPGDDSTLSSSGSYTTVEVDPIGRPGGGNLTVADFASGDLQFDLRCITDPVLAAVRCTSIWLEVDYDAANAPLDPYREVVARRLRMFQSEPGVYKVRVPLEFLSRDVMDDIGLAAESIPRSSTLLSNVVDHLMVDSWRRLYTKIIDATLDMDSEDRSIVLTLLDMEPPLCILWDTFASPFDVNSDLSVSEFGQKHNGIASLSAGALRTEERGSVGFILDSAARLGSSKLAVARDGVAKSNHLGTLIEDAINNLVSNSCGIDKGITTISPDGWTLVESTGDISILSDGPPPLFELVDAVSPGTEFDQRVVTVTKGTGDTYMHRTITVADADHRITFWTLEDELDGEWFFQRPNGDYFDDSDGSWSVSIVWNPMAASANADWRRTISKVITSPGAGTATVGIGLNSGSAGDKFHTGQVMCYESNLVYSDVITDNTPNTIGGTEDTIYDEINNAGADDRQVIHPDRGTIRFTLRAEQDGANIEEGAANAHVLGLARWDADTDYDMIQLEKVSGQTRIGYERVRGGSSDGKAFADLTLVRGTEYEVAVRWTSPSDGELGLPAYTLSVFVDGVKGTDDQATGTHSSSAQVTQYYYGSFPSGFSATLRRAMNYVRNFEDTQRVYPDEEILARRP